MHVQVLNKLCNLRTNVLKMVPDTATSDNIWESLGWDQEAHRHYTIARDYGIDLRPILAPLFSDVVSLVVDGLYVPKGHNWDTILDGQDPDFKGLNPKQRLMSVFDYILSAHLDS